MLHSGLLWVVSSVPMGTRLFFGYFILVWMREFKLDGEEFPPSLRGGERRGIGGGAPIKLVRSG